MSGHESALHASLIQRILKANPTARTHGFFGELIRHVVAESGDVSEGEYSETLVDPYAERPSNFQRLYLDRVSSYIRGRIGTGVIPDAFQLPEDALVAVVWEVSVTNSYQSSQKKWGPLALELDGFDPWVVVVVHVDSTGTARAEIERGLWLLSDKVTDENCSERIPLTWSVDEPCPLNWRDEFGFTETDRVRLGGIKLALSRRLAEIRLKHDRLLSVEAE